MKFDLDKKVPKIARGRSLHESIVHVCWKSNYFSKNPRNSFYFLQISYTICIRKLTLDNRLEYSIFTSFFKILALPQLFVHQLYMALSISIFSSKETLS